MKSPPFDSTHGWQRRAWHDISAVGLHTRSDDVEPCMTSPPLDSTHGQTTSGVACHYRLWTAHTVKGRHAWQPIIAFGQHTRSIDVGHGMTSSPLGSTTGQKTSCMACHHRRWTRSYSQTVSGVACHLRLSAAQMVEQRWAWHHITAFGQHTRSNDIGCRMLSSPLGSTHSRTTSGVACHHSP